MKNVIWTHLGPDGISTTVHLKHGTTSGNLILFSRGNILLIDFDVFDDKVYTFFINDELCEIYVYKTEEGFLYEFKIVKDVDTPLNRWRKRMLRKEKRLTIIIGTLLTGCLIGFIALFFTYKFQLKKQELKTHGLITMLTFDVQDKEFAGKQYNSRYKYYFRLSKYGEYYNLETNTQGQLIGDHGLPVESGDSFFVKFSKKHPDIHHLDFFHPTLQQLDKYKERFGKNLTLQPGQLDCLFSTFLELEGVSGLAHLYYSQTPPEANKKYNQATFQKRISQPEVSQRLRKCGYVFN